jgi:hypothetical protein
MSAYHYRTLCDITIRHAYFLDNGTTGFDDMAAPQQKEFLARFDFREVVALVPTAKTQGAMSGRKIQAIVGNEGIRLIVRTLDSDLKPVTGIEQDLVLVFALKIRHTRFAYFTDLVLDDPNSIRLFANTLIPGLTTQEKLIPRLSEMQRADESFRLSAADSETILNSHFAGEDRHGLIGLVYLRVIGDTPNHGLLNLNGETKVSPANFKLHFSTTSTHWKYIKESDDFVAETELALPLTKHGFIEINPASDFTADPPDAALDYSYPNPSLESFEITPERTYSVIFI